MNKDKEINLQLFLSIIKGTKIQTNGSWPGWGIRYSSNTSGFHGEQSKN